MGEEGTDSRSSCLPGLTDDDNLVRVTYNKSSSPDGEIVTFVGTLSPVPRALATPVLVAAGILLLVAGTSTSVGGTLSSAFGVVKTTYDAGAGLIAVPMTIIMILFIVALVLALFGAGIYYFGRFAFRGFRPDPEVGVGGFYLAIGIIVLVMLALLIFSLFFAPDPWIDEMLGPIRTVWGWVK